MTDITELTQSEINDALAQLKQISEYPATSTQYARVLRKYIASLVEALEKAQCANDHLREQSAEWERKAISNFQECATMSERIYLLESRTVPVKFPHQTDFDDPLSAYEAIEKCKDALTAAGITLLHTTNKEEIPMQEKINELSVVIANFLHEEDPEEFCEENSGNRAELLADKLAEFLVNNGHA